MTTFIGQNVLPLGLESQKTPTTAHMATAVPDMDEEQGPGPPTTEECFQIQQSNRFSFPAANNCSEYEALLAGLRLAHDLKVDCRQVYSDFQLVYK